MKTGFDYAYSVTEMYFANKTYKGYRKLESLFYSDSNVVCAGLLCLMGPAKKGKRNVQGVPQSQPADPSRHQEEEETDKT